MKKEIELGTIGEGGCPCGEYKCKDYRIKAHCWRAGSCCNFSGVHYDKAEGKEHAQKIAEYMRMAWNTEVRVSKKRLAQENKS